MFAIYTTTIEEFNYLIGKIINKTILNFEKSMYISIFFRKQLLKDTPMYEISSPIVLYDHDQDVMVITA